MDLMPYTTTATELQRNYKKVAKRARQLKDAVIVLSNNSPEGVYMDYDTYVKKLMLKNEISGISEKEKLLAMAGTMTGGEVEKLNKDIDEANEKNICGRLAMKSIILDTNAYSNFKKGDKSVINAIKNSDIIFISSVVVGELYSGFYQGNKLQENEKQLIEFLENGHIKVCNISVNSAKIYGQLYSKLIKNGTPIPTNDIWIAACAIETNSTLVTFDKHFLKVPSVKVWDKI